MKRLVRILTVISLVSFAVACDSKGAEGGAEDKAAEAPVAKVEKLTAEGQEFDPAIKPEAVPDGAWYCDMGTVHYARSEKGDGTCPLCKMKLKEKAAAKK